MRLAIIVGSAAPSGRTQAVGSYLAGAMSRHPAVSVELLDIATLAHELADGRPIEAYDRSIRAAVATVDAAHGIVIVSPVYRATFTGALKNFADILPMSALRDKPLALAVVGASVHHYLGVDYAIRALAAWFGALALPTSVFLSGEDFDESKVLLPKAAQTLNGLAETLARVSEVLASRPFAPPPLGASPG